MLAITVRLAFVRSGMVMVVMRSRPTCQQIRHQYVCWTLPKESTTTRSRCCYSRSYRNSRSMRFFSVFVYKQDGSIVLGGAVGAAVEMAQIARKIIIEVNTAMPSYKGLHDIVMQTRPPHRRPFGISRVDDKIGTISLPIQLDKVAGIIESKRPDKGRPMGPADDVSNQIAGHLMQFFEHEVKVGRLPKSLLPLQSGVGNVANAVISGLSSAPFENLTVWTEVIQDSVLDLFDNGKLLYATATGLALSETATERLYKNWDKYSKKICLRPGAITNLPEIIRRLGVIAMNTYVKMNSIFNCEMTFDHVLLSSTSVMIVCVFVFIF